MDRPAVRQAAGRPVFAAAARSRRVIAVGDLAGAGSVPRRVRRRRLFGWAAVRCRTIPGVHNVPAAAVAAVASRTTPTAGRCGRRMFSAAAVRGGVGSSVRLGVRGPSRARRRPRQLFCAAQRAQLGSALAVTPLSGAAVVPVELDLTPAAAPECAGERIELSGSCESPLFAVAQRTLLPAPSVPAAGVPPVGCAAHDPSPMPLGGTAAALSVCDPATVEQDAAAAGVPPAALRRRVARFASVNRSAAHVMRSRPDNRC